ncbi:NOB1 family endonuclease [Halobellus salinisoli]|uniref:NOB1 family endonuclease n=1 Tax=Halobellus salinisoli TaxID=3108500 RepID=UPI00300A06EA
MQILDSSAFIHEYHTTDDIASIPMVREELEGEASYRYDADEGSGMHIHIPAAGTVEKIQRAAGETGDAEALSETDVRLLAAAFELDAVLVTDDYAMQNVADHVDIDVKIIAREGISEKREWTFQCQGCGREFDEHRDRCPICGTELARKNPA